MHALVAQKRHDMPDEFWDQLKPLLDGMAAAGFLDSNVGPISRYKVVTYRPCDSAADRATAAGEGIASGFPTSDSQKWKASAEELQVYDGSCGSRP